MGYTKIPMQVVLADGQELELVADQRDLARWEAHGLPDTRMFTRVRFLAWSALHRSKQYTGTWDKFNTEDCVEASDLPDADEEEADEGAERLDPGPKDQSAAT